MNTLKISKYFFLVVFLLITEMSFAQVNNSSQLMKVASEEEALYNQYQRNIFSSYLFPTQLYPFSEDTCDKSNGACLSHLEIAIQAFDQLAKSKYLKNFVFLRDEAMRLQEFATDLGERLQLFIILTEATSETDSDWLNELATATATAIQNHSLSKKAVFTLLAHPHLFKGDKWNSIFAQIARLEIASPAPIASQQALVDLIQVEPPIDQYNSGRYKNKPRIYMFCRSQRKYACLMVMKNSDGKIRRLANGTVWTQPSLGYSKFQKEFNQTNGNTPAGVLRIDGVMPDADKPNAFGKFRRMILNFVSESNGEAQHKLLFPPSSQSETWWQQAMVARDVGRGLFRIHGTGLKSDETATYFPLVPTSGCVAKRENTYGRVTYKDQRELLDELMKASNLKPTFENEVNIRGLLYIVNINDEKKNVELKDLEAMGIL